MLQAIGILLVASCLSGEPLQAGPADQGELVRPLLVSATTAAMPGETLWLGVVLEMEDDWHVYWDGMNDTGLPVDIVTRLPRGWKAGEVLWPAPTRHVSPGDLLDHVYHDRVTLLLPIEVPVDAVPGTKATLSVDCDWLACKEACVRGNATLSLVIPVAGDAWQMKPSRHVAMFDEFRARVPMPPATDDLDVSWSDGRVSIRAPGAEGMVFFPRNGCVTPADLLADGQSEGDRLDVRLQGEDDPGLTLDGVVEVRRPDGRPSEFFLVKETRP